MKYVDDGDFVLYVGDVLEQLADLPDRSVHCVVTSPPYWGLRDYSTPGQIGLEATPDEFVARMVAVFREVRRVLRDDGTLWLNLGDSYFAAGATGGSFTGGKHETIFPMKPKDLVGMPWRVAFALQADGWYLRADIVWSKPNPMPESVTDRPTKAHEYVFLMSKRPRYYYDAEAVREPHAQSSLERGYGYRAGKAGPSKPRGGESRQSGAASRAGGLGDWREGLEELRPNPAGRNVRSVWEIATQPYPDAHFATFPEALPERCIKAGTSERGVCPECGAPWERIVEARSLNRNELPRDHPEWRPSRYDNGKAGDPQSPGPGQRFHESPTTGWRPTCGCGVEDTVPATILDPFMGSGTSAFVARRLGRRSVGVELNPSYAELAARRLQQLSLLA